VRAGQRVVLGDTPTRVASVYHSKREYRQMLRSQVSQLSKLQRRFWASRTYALLLVFQAMDTAGKDGSIRHVMSGVNPQGCRVHSFGKPTPDELDHDFLWRTSLRLPERGFIGIFNRSYYEEVLVVRVHPEILQSQRLPAAAADPPAIWLQRYRSILDHEQHLTENGTRIVKFFLHISKEEQRQRLIDRLQSPEKIWKSNLNDVEEREYWDSYMEAYEDCLNATSTEASPWYVIPADDKRNARLFVSRVILDTLSNLELDYPAVTPEREEELAQIRERLAVE
jgi:PPK2 family polyphosphate:nucleotide phosphotransferase